LLEVDFRRAEETKETSGTRSKGTNESHVQVRELWQLAQLSRQPLELIVVHLTGDGRQITIHSIQSSHEEMLELCQLADRWQRRELVVVGL